MKRRYLLVLGGIGALMVAPDSVRAQASGQYGPAGRTTAGDSVFRRAIALVNDGEGVAGRALLDSMVQGARPGSLEYAEALYWRATVAANAVDAEGDYRRIILDHPLSSRIPDALLRLAQLELTRGDRESALRHLQRLEVEYPSGPGRVRTSYWMARVLFAQNDVVRGCAAVADARARLAATDVEMRNQIDYLAQRCSVVAPAPATTVAVSPAVPRDVRPSVRRDSVVAPTARGRWSIQIGAFNVRNPANALAARLRARGHDARVDGTAVPFRVRIGRYATRAAAATALRGLEAKGMEGFVTRIDTR